MGGGIDDVEEVEVMLLERLGGYACIWCASSGELDPDDFDSIASGVIEPDDLSSERERERA